MPDRSMTDITIPPAVLEARLRRGNFPRVSTMPTAASMKRDKRLSPANEANMIHAIARVFGTGLACKKKRVILRLR